MALSKYDIELDLARAPDSSHAYMVGMVGSNKRVLDVGCDTGYLGETLIALGCRVWGVEVNPETAEVAAQKLERVVVGDLEALDLVEEFGEAAFDVVVFGDVLEHLRDPLPVLRNARRLLAPGGSVVISTPNIAHGDIRLALLSGRFRYTQLGILDETHTRFFTTESLTQFVLDAGFDLVELRRTTAPLFSTEQALSREAFPAEVVAALEGDVEATTYQFVARAALQDAGSRTTAVALELDRTQAKIKQVEAHVARLEAEVARLGGELAQAHAEETACREQMQSQLAERDRVVEGLQIEVATARDAGRTLQKQLDEARTLIAAFEHLKSVRAARAIRRIAPSGRAESAGSVKDMAQ